MDKMAVVPDDTAGVKVKRWLNSVLGLGLDLRVKVVPNVAREGKAKRWLKRIFHMGGIAALIWSVAIWITMNALSGKSIPPVRAATPGDFEALLFGASSVALIIFSLVIGVVAFFGYDYLRRDTATEVQENIQRQIKELDKELRGRVSSSIGLMLGVMHSTPGQQSEDERLDYLAESITHSEQAYAALKEVGSKSQWTALNNIIYYSCSLGNKIYKKDHLLERAEELRLFSRDNLPEPFIEGLLTYCRAILIFSDDPEAIERAYRISSGLLSEKLSDRHKNEATNYVASLQKKRVQKTST